MAPDSKSLAYIGADPPGENNWWVAKLYSQAPGGDPSIVVDPTKVSGDLHNMQIAVPRWSPDGNAIAFIGGLMSDQGATGGDVWVVPAAGGQPHDLTPDRTSSPAWIAWAGNQTLFASEIRLRWLPACLLNPEGDPASADLVVDSTKTIFTEPGTVGANSLQLSLSPSADRSIFVFRESSFSSPPEIFAARQSHSPGSSSITTTCSNERRPTLAGAKDRFA